MAVFRKIGTLLWLLVCDWTFSPADSIRYAGSANILKPLAISESSSVQLKRYVFESSFLIDDPLICLMTSFPPSQKCSHLSTSGWRQCDVARPLISLGQLPSLYHLHQLWGLSHHFSLMALPPLVVELLRSVRNVSVSVFWRFLSGKLAVGNTFQHPLYYINNYINFQLGLLWSCLHSMRRSAATILGRCGRAIAASREDLSHLLLPKVTTVHNTVSLTSLRALGEHPDSDVVAFVWVQKNLIHKW